MIAAKSLAYRVDSSFDCTVLLSQSDLESITKVVCTQPHGILGMHPFRKKKGRPGVVVRAYVNDAVTCEVVDLRDTNGPRYPMERLSKDGFFEVLIEDQPKVFPYRLRIERYNGEIRQFYDPYSYLPTLSEEEVYLFNEGNEHFIHNKLGAHIRTIDEVPGVSFAVWAPNAIRVSVVGDFNHWDGRYHPMRSLGASGIWELFVPGLGEGAKYKFEIGTRHGYPHLKTDPYGTRFEAPPYNASIVCKLDDYKWSDEEWIKRRETTDWNAVPLSVYEMHVGSWKRVVEDANRPLTYRELAVEL
ncbi:MAG: 1,4-alpha-glucan branching enzyme, partial [Verrucomicrobiota bacterium]